uniref:HAT C-terminal dimerisation domain-containing protein n=1 Tax=Amphimedon queenslandica TaxID=400682 RepID=A0A1X7V5Q8_AMPQE
MKSLQGNGTVSKIMADELDRRFNSFLNPKNARFNPIYIVATSLDLRYKVALSTDQLKYAKTYLTNQCYSLPRVQPSVNAPTSNEPPCKRFRLLSQLVIEKQQDDEWSNESTTIDNDDMQEYFRSKHQLPNLNQLDPLDFCTQIEHSFPKLAPFAQDILVAQASSTPGKRIFSKAGYSSSGRRNRLAGSNVERKVLLKTKKQCI